MKLEYITVGSMTVGKIPRLKHMCWPHGPRNDVRGQDIVEE